MIFLFTCNCPKCHSDNIYKEEFEETEKGGFRTVICEDCQHQWTNYYTYKESKED